MRPFAAAFVLVLAGAILASGQSAHAATSVATFPVAADASPDAQSLYVGVNIANGLKTYGLNDDTPRSNWFATYFSQGNWLNNGVISPQVGVSPGVNGWSHGYYGIIEVPAANGGSFSLDYSMGGNGVSAGTIDLGSKITIVKQQNFASVAPGFCNPLTAEYIPLITHAYGQDYTYFPSTMYIFPYGEDSGIPVDITDPNISFYDTRGGSRVLVDKTKVSMRLYSVDDSTFAAYMQTPGTGCDFVGTVWREDYASKWNLSATGGCGTACLLVRLNRTDTPPPPPPAQPDLTAGATTVTPASIAAGKTGSFSATISNIGTGAALDPPNEFQVSSPQLNGAAYVVANTISSLASGASTVISGSYLFPSEGSYSIRACTDLNTQHPTLWRGTNTEPNEMNNCGGWTTITVLASASPGVTPLPDLTAGAVTPITATVGVATTLSVPISNIGTGDTSATFHTVFQSAADGNGTSAGNPAAGSNIVGLASSGTKTATFTWTPSTVKTYYLRACADNDTSWNGLVTESDEDNNCGAWTAVAVAAACSSKQGTSCPLTSDQNACLQTTVSSISGTYDCSGVCVGTKPAVPAVTTPTGETYGATCNPKNTCGQSSPNGPGTITCDGVCSVSAPADFSCPVTPTGTWTPATLTCPAACGTDVSIQTQTCTGGTCSGTAATLSCAATAPCVVDACGPASGTKPKDPEPTGTQACAVGALNASTPPTCTTGGPPCCASAP